MTTLLCALPSYHNILLELPILIIYELTSVTDDRPVLFHSIGSQSLLLKNIHPLYLMVSLCSRPTAGHYFGPSFVELFCSGPFGIISTLGILQIDMTSRAWLWMSLLWSLFMMPSRDPTLREDNPPWQCHATSLSLTILILIFLIMADNRIDKLSALPRYAT